MHLMIDLETLDTGPNAVVSTVGLVWFTLDKVVRQDYYRLNIEFQLLWGRTVSLNTLNWWSQQKKDVRTEMFSLKDRIHPTVLFQNINFDAKTVWGNGSEFDIAIIQSLHKQCKLHDSNCPVIPLWSYHKSRCFRTFKNLYDPERRLKPTNENLHNAVADALAQAEWLIGICRKYNITF